MLMVFSDFNLWRCIFLVLWSWEKKLAAGIACLHITASLALQVQVVDVKLLSARQM